MMAKHNIEVTSLFCWFSLMAPDKHCNTPGGAKRVCYLSSHTHGWGTEESNAVLWILLCDSFLKYNQYTVNLFI